MERDRATDLAVLREVHEAAQQRNHERAATLAQAALDRGLEHPLLFNVIALRLEHEQRVVEAAALLSRAVQLAPRDAGVRNALGLCLLRLERPAEALVQFEALLALDPTLSFVYASRGAALLALGWLAAAEAALRRPLCGPRECARVHPGAHAATRADGYRGVARTIGRRGRAGRGREPDFHTRVSAFRHDVAGGSARGKSRHGESRRA